MRIFSWNVNGIRAAVKKGFGATLASMEPDVLCVQETKAQDAQVKEALKHIDGYHLTTNSAVKKGYAGTAVLTKKMPAGIQPDMGVDAHDQEGRIIALDLDGCYLVTVYTPNSGSELKRLSYRAEWDAAFLQYLKNLEKKKPVIVCGDFNVAHKPIDLARPGPNYNKTAGYTQVEIDGMDNLQGAGFVDTYRHQHPGEVKYSWWSYRAQARKKNIGWRIDYFLVSESLTDRIGHTDILDHIEGSDHCPILLDLT